MTLRQCQAGDVVVIRGGLHAATLANLEIADGDHTVRVGSPLAGGIGVDLVDEFTLSARDFTPRDGMPRYGFAIADGAAPVVEIIERTKFPRGKRADDVGGRGEDVVDPLNRRRDGLV